MINNFVLIELKLQQPGKNGRNEVFTDNIVMIMMKIFFKNRILKIL